MITTMRLDLQRLATGWSPTQTAPDMPTSNPEPIDEPEKEYAEADIEMETDEKENVEKEIEYNILDIDFDKMLSDGNDDSLNQMHNYFASVEPTAKNEYTGRYEGYNLIFLTAESFAPYAVHEDVTPTLYKMVHEGYNFTDFYVPLWDVSSSDGEYVSLTSLVPKSGIWSFSASADIDLPYVMGNQLKELGYNTVAYHNHTYTYYNRDASHPNMGYDYKGIGNGLEISGGWPRSDLEMMQETVPEYIDNEPFHAYYVTVSGHMQYSFAGNNIAYKNKEYVADLPYSEQAKAYLATQIELDKALENMLNQLEEAGIADKTLIVLATDHYPYGLDNSTIDELAGHNVDRAFELYKSPLILYSKDMDPVTVDKPSSNLDLVPTLYNLLGVEYDSRLFMGSDIFSDSSPLVMFRNKSFITDRGKYNSATKEFIPTEEDSSDDYYDYIDAISLIVDNKFYYSVKILETDYYKEFN
ncbi:LTA synthase family protein [Alkalibacterium sp. f15]|uniref:LTA synthase family protein n=1 Tax=Alkalibacterium sp. f15 TaxID=3414029 RepID=UPI003BF7FD49